jgi:hypothetical protein
MTPGSLKKFLRLISTGPDFEILRGDNPELGTVANRICFESPKDCTARDLRAMLRDGATSPFAPEAIEAELKRRRCWYR